MGLLDFFSTLAEPAVLALLAIAVGMPLLLFPGTGGMGLSALLAVWVLWLNHRLESAVRRLPVLTGAEALRGRKVVAQERLTPFGIVKLGSEMWRAVEVRGRSIEPGEKVLVVGIRGLMLEVIAIN